MEPEQIPHTHLSSVHWLSPEAQGEWDAFVTRHPLGLVYHLSSWQRVLESTFGHIRGRLLVLRDEGGQIQAGLPVYTVKSWILGNRTVSVPFATMCDPLISTKEAFNLLWSAIENASQKHRSRRIEIRTRHINTDCMPAVLTAGESYKHHYLPIEEPTDALFRSFHNSTIRQRIKKAMREGAVVEERQDEQDLRVLHNILAATRRRQLLPPIPFAFYQAMQRSLGSDHFAFYLAIQKGEPVGGILILKFRDLWTAEYSGTADNAISGISPLLYWEAIQRAKSGGAGCFSFGRTTLDNTGLLDFKRRWATIEEDLTYFSSCSGCKKAAQGYGSAKTCCMALPRAVIRLIVRYAPAAVQKFIGDFCYRHLG